MARDILVVDDEADIRMLITGILHDEGYATREAADSDSAIEAIAMAKADMRASQRRRLGALGARAPALVTSTDIWIPFLPVVPSPQHTGI